MSVRHQSQDQAVSTYAPTGGRHLLLHRAVIASTSLLAIAAALGWSNPALAAGTCGAPAGGVANCNATSYPAGIEYAGADAVDDLTVNVGTFAGQSAAVTVGGPGIVVADTLFADPTTSETVNVGGNVSISSAVYNGITAVSTAYQAAYGGAQATASSTVTNQGGISTTGAYGQGIYAASVAQSVAGYFYSATSGAYSTVSNTGIINTTGMQASGINTFSQAIAGVTPAPSGAYYGIANAVAVVNNSGNITTTGVPGGAFGADGIYAGAYAVAGGIYGARGTATVDVTNTGTISTSGDLAIGIQGNAQGVGESYTDFATGGAYVSITNGGKITTKGNAAAGISATTLAVGNSYSNAYAYSQASVVNAGRISTAGAGSDGISVQAKGASYGYFASVYTLASVTNTGIITTTGDGSMGIYALAGSQPSGLLSAPYANTVVLNSGKINTKGAGSIGILGVSSTYAPGSYVYSAARTTITNSGSVSTSGDGAPGIYALSQSTAASYATLGSDYNGKTYAASTVTNAGTVTTSGVGSVGVLAVSKANAYSALYGHAHAVTTVTNAGSVTTKGAGAHGLVAQSTAVSVTPASSAYQSTGIATTTATNVGAISVSGAGSNGIIATAGSTALGTVSGASATSTTMVTNVGKITASGIGIEAYAGAYASSTSGAKASATSTVANAGSVNSTGAGGVGVLVASVGATNTGAVATSSTLVNAATGSIVASGAGGVGAKVEGAYSTLVTYAGSTISGGTGAGAVGVYMNGAENIVSNAGTIASGNDAALSMTGIYANIVKNTGTITGTVTLHSGAGGQNVLYNYGTWNAVGGNSDFTHGAGGGSNLANEAGGTIFVMGSQSFTGLDKFTNVGTVDLTQGHSGFETLTVSGDYEGIGGVLKVDASTQGGMQGDKLVIQGAASGSTKVKPTIVGTPGQTTGNGILLVSAASGTASSEFTLSGNASNGSEVAGAFEYNLDFVPGTGTAGDWYLQSQVYPGVYQFGQVESSSAIISDQVNPDLNDLLNQAFNSTVQTASLVDTSQQVASTDNSFVPPANAGGLSGWGRFDEARFNIDPNGSSAANYKLRVDAAQFGIDDNWHDADNLVMVGGYMTPFNAFSDFSSLGGHINSKGTAYGVYGLWFSGPWQAGVRLNYDAESARFTDNALGTDATVKPNEEGVQVAASYDMALDWADFTPSGEFNYGKVRGVHFADGVGDLVQLGATNDVWGKLNGRFSWDVTTDHGFLVQPYVNIGLLYRGDTDTSTNIGTFSTSTNVNGFDGDFAVGVNTNIATGLSLSAQGEYLAGDRVKGWAGFVGLRYSPEAVETPQPTPAPAAPPPPPPAPPPPTKTFIVFFDFNKSNLTAEAQSVVSEAVKTAKSSGMVRVLVTGHTDTVGSDSYNMGLSVRRAQSVKDEMVNEGIDGSGISIEGKGFHDPLVPTGPGVREPQNRRAVIDLGG